MSQHQQLKRYQRDDARVVNCSWRRQITQPLFRLLTSATEL